VGHEPAGVLCSGGELVTGCCGGSVVGAGGVASGCVVEEEVSGAVVVGG